jgi:hypothetical protein
MSIKKNAPSYVGVGRPIKTNGVSLSKKDNARYPGSQLACGQPRAHRQGRLSGPTAHANCRITFGRLIGVPSLAAHDAPRI